MSQAVNNLVLATARLRLRAFWPEDAEALYEYLSDPAIYRFEPGEPLDRSQAAQRAQVLATAPDFWAVELLAENKVIGQLYFSPVGPPELATWELGYILNPRYQRQGYASEAAAALLRYGFSALGIHRVTAYCSPENVASWKLLEKVGFRREGLLKCNIFFRRDAAGAPLWLDSYAYAILTDEFKRELK